MIVWNSQRKRRNERRRRKYYDLNGNNKTHSSYDIARNERVNEVKIMLNKMA